MEFIFKNQPCSVHAGLSVMISVAKIDPERAHQLIQDKSSKRFYSFSHPCLSEIDIFKLEEGYIIVYYNPFSNAYVYETEQDFFISNVLRKFINAKHISSDYPRHRIYYGKSCIKVHFIEIDERHRELLYRTGDPVDIIENKLDSPVIKTIYGDYIFQENRLFNTLPELKAYIEIVNIRHQLDNPEEPYESRCVAGRNIYGEQFVDHIPEMMDQLAELLRAPRAWFDFSIEHRDKVQLYFFRQIFTDAFNDKAFLPMLAYLGEMHRHFYKSGEWILDYDPIYDCWNPDIRREDGMMARMDRTLYRIMDSKSPKYRQLWNVVVSKKS